MTIRGKLGALTSGLVFLVVGLTGAIQYAAERRTLGREMERRLADDSLRLAALAEAALTEGDLAPFEAAAAGSALYASLVRSDGKTLLRRARAGVKEPLNEDGVRAAFADRAPRETTYALAEARVLERVVPLKATSASLSGGEADRPRAVALRAGYDLSAERAAVAAAAGGTLRRFLWAAIASLGFGLAGANLLAGSFTRTIKKLMQGAQQVSSGHFSARVITRREDELGELSAEFNAMSHRLGELERLKDSFLAKITHDLRSPLGAVIGHADLMLMGTRGPLTDKQADSMRVVIQSCNDLAELIDNILDLTKLEAGKLAFTPSAVPLRPAVQAVLDLLGPKAAEFGVALDATGVPDSVGVWADEQALRRLLTNLVSNSLKFTPKDGRVSVEWRHDGPSGDRIVVRDTGIGIPADKIPSLFTKFVQVEETMHKVRFAKGTGLGLVICKEIVESHGGRIWAESEYERGSAFSFTLPAAPPQAYSK
ncbi:MAG: HAMP domain-containing histidine kinase [Elusimicrobia bacterium]|nr:HAMP domain-containing histidine kinase [Elusimicrobiota bacterium]